MERMGDSTTRLALPLDESLGPLVIGPTRSFLHLYHLPRSASEFITERLASAVGRLGMKVGARPARLGLTLCSRAGKVRVILRVFRAGSSDLRLAPLAKGAPSGVRAEYRTLLHGGTLTFTTTLKRGD